MGNNGLASFMDSNFSKILKAAPAALEHGKIAVFYDRGNYTRLTQLFMGEDGTVKQRIMKQWSPEATSSVDPQFMKEVFDLVEQELPSDSYGVVFSSHGGGWVPSDIFDLYLENDRTVFSAESTTKFFGQDGLSCMEIPDLASVLSRLSPDYVIFDACLMASVEALYDLRNVTDYIVASPIEVAGTGFPYEDFLSMLFLEHSGPVKVCEAFASYYQGSFGAVSLIDCGMLSNLAVKMKAVLASASSQAIPVDNIQSYDGFKSHLYFDLLDYVQNLDADETAVKEFEETLSEAILFNWHTDAFWSDYGQAGEYPLTNSCGLSCHIALPSAPKTHAAYLETAWASAVGAK